MSGWRVVDDWHFGGGYWQQRQDGKDASFSTREKRAVVQIQGDLVHLAGLKMRTLGVASANGETPQRRRTGAFGCF